MLSVLLPQRAGKPKNAEDKRPWGGMCIVCKDIQLIVVGLEMATNANDYVEFGCIVGDDIFQTPIN